VLVIAPGKSNLPRLRGESASARGAMSATAAPMGTLTNSTQRQDR
jgi:hypothetical protein